MDQAEQKREPDADRAVAITEAVLFAAADPLSLIALADVTGLPEAAQGAALAALEQRMATDPSCGLCVRRINERFCLTTKPELKDDLLALFEPRHAPKLSKAAYEALAVIAYNQPVTRAQIEAVRGVNSDNVIGRLIERGLIESVGQLDAPGRPSLFATTDRFLLEMGLESVDDLPPMELMMYGTLQDFEQVLQEADA
jgi:segregation and condensation protein B